MGAFLGQLPLPRRTAYEGLTELAQLLAKLLVQASAAWPTLSIPQSEFLAFIAERLPPGIRPRDAIGGLHVGDLYLSCGCVRGERRALECFEQEFADEIDRGVSSMAGDPIRAEDFKQEVRHKLFVGTSPAGPKIAEYSGHGSLRSWVRVTARRTYVDLMRVEDRDPAVFAGDHVVDALAGETDPELEYVKHRYRDEFRAAFTSALASLNARQRNLLRHHYVHGLRFDEVAGIFRVHRATIARWIAEAREVLLERTRAELREQLAIDTDDVDDIMRVLQADLGMNVTQLLKPAQP